MPASQPPNVLLIMTDQQQGFTVHPDHPCRTPNVERLAEQGVRFERAYTPCAVCTPARASLYSSYYPHDHGMLTVEHSRPALTLLRHEPMRYFTGPLRQLGYQTIHVGRWHITANDPSGAFEETYTIADFAADRKKAGMSRFHAIDTLEDPVYLRRPGWKDWLAAAITTEPEELTITGGLGLKAEARLRELCRSQRPWLLTYSVFDPHDPFSCPRRFAEMYDPAGIAKPPNWDDPLTDRPALYRRQRRALWDKIPWSDQAKCISRYWGACSHVDDRVGRLLEILDQTGQAENTLVIYVSDHGDMMAGHSLFLKGILPFEEAWRVPLVIRWPAGIPARGGLDDQIVSLLDVAPTILRAAGADVWDDARGRPLQDVVAGKVDRRSFYGEFHGGEYYFTQRVLWHGQHKFVFNAFDEDELYDLAADPHEMRNVSNDPAYRGVKDACLKEFWRQHRQSHDFLDISYPNVALVEQGPGCLGAD